MVDVVVDVLVDEDVEVEVEVEVVVLVAGVHVPCKHTPLASPKRQALPSALLGPAKHCWLKQIPLEMH